MISLNILFIFILTLENVADWCTEHHSSPLLEALFRDWKANNYISPTPLNLWIFFLASLMPMHHVRVARQVWGRVRIDRLPSKVAVPLIFPAEALVFGPSFHACPESGQRDLFWKDEFYHVWHSFDSGRCASSFPILLFLDLSRWSNSAGGPGFWCHWGCCPGKIIL